MNNETCKEIWKNLKLVETNDDLEIYQYKDLNLYIYVYLLAPDINRNINTVYISNHGGIDNDDLNGEWYDLNEMQIAQIIEDIFLCQKPTIPCSFEALGITKEEAEKMLEELSNFADRQC